MATANKNYVNATVPTSSQASSNRSLFNGVAQCGAKLNKENDTEGCSTSCWGKVWCSRLSLVASLLASAAILGWAAHYLSNSKEQQLGTTQFASIAERALVGAQQTLSRRRSGTASIATLHASLFPNASVDWPFVAVPRFNEIAREVSLTSAGLPTRSSGVFDGTTSTEGFVRDDTMAEESGHGIGFVPFISPDQIEEFNEFQREYLETYFPPARGVYQFPPFELPDGTIAALSPSRYNISAPLAQMYAARPDQAQFVMLDLFSTILYRPSIDHHLEVAEENEAANASNVCGIYSHLVRQPADNAGPISHYTHPVYPFGSRSKVVGMVSSPIQWNLVLRNVFSSKVSGLQCILESSNGVVHTFEIVKGQPIYTGAGLTSRSVENMQHTPQYHKGLSITLTENLGLCQNRSVEYSLTLIPTAEFYKSFSTANPTVAWIGAVLVIALTSILFSIYDFFVRKDMRDKRTVIQTNRTFLRFVSHEVRTPLNTVSMGLKVMCDDVQDMIGPEDNEHAGDEPANRSDEKSSLPTNDIAQQRNAGDDGTIRVSRRKIDRLVELANEINVSADSAVEILSDVLSYDKIEHGELQLELTTFPIWNLLLRILSEFEVPAKAKDLTLMRACSGVVDDSETATLQNVLVNADEVRLAQVLRNLLSNAVKFTPEGGTIKAVLQRVGSSSIDVGALPVQAHNTPDITGGVSCPSCRPVGNIELSLTDSGVGMTHGQTKSAFGQGVQFDANSLQEGKGSGLGLFIAKGIIVQHGGTLSAKSEGLNCGSTFALVLPAYEGITKAESASTNENKTQSTPSVTFRAVAEDGSVSQTIETSEAAEQNVESPKLRALVVDDAPMNRKLLSRLLERRGWTCDCAEDGKVAVDMFTVARAQHVPYDCILLDYEMPVMNGPDAAKHLRALGCESCMVGVTGNVLPDDVAYFVSCGVASVFHKPVNLEELDTFWRDTGVLPPKEGYRDESLV